MRVTILAAAVLSVISLPATIVSAILPASAFAATVAQGQEAVSHAGRMMDAANSRMQSAHDAAVAMGGQLGSDGTYAGGMESGRQTMNQAATQRANAQAQMNGAISTLANAVATQAGPMATPSVNPNAVLQATPTIHAPQAVPTKTPTYSVPTVQIKQLTPQRTPSKQPQITGASYRAYVNQLQAENPAQSINVAASSLKPSTPVNVTVNGVTQTTTAGAIAAVNPAEQIAVPHVAAFQRTAVKGGSSNDHSHSSHVQGDNNGGSNSHANAMGARGQAGQRSGKSAAGNF
ncbi:hypothetical protein FHW11_000452 [Pantoea agglomerans]|uniref:hypothetical protein n=1 Tax=Enterobacter agglomerans TaxID=549 RepID=UPI0015F8D5F7|nr:hypothetical protein [Pantoea agglomerans]MBA8863366.1 hypothetical protein [Pantoea agglomerans]MBA8890349.1 hypothetical protein [Pantoea agglomerans]